MCDVTGVGEYNSASDNTTPRGAGGGGGCGSTSCASGRVCVMLGGSLVTVSTDLLDSFSYFLSDTSSVGVFCDMWSDMFVLKTKFYHQT